MMTVNRRNCLRNMLSVGALAGWSGSWPGKLAGAMEQANTGRHLILLWMPGGPSQMDTFDLKPGTTNGGPFKELQTTVPGLQFSEHLPKLSDYAQHLSIIRGMQTKEGDHSRGTYLLRTGQRPGAPTRYPALPAALAKELAIDDPSIPSYVSVLPNVFINPAAFSAGFLGASREPLTVGSNATFNPNAPAGPTTEPPALRVDNLLPPAFLEKDRINRRKQFWNMLQESYGAASRAGAAATHDTVYRRAMQLADSSLVEAFDLQQESAEVRQRYGVDSFGQGCLMARRLIERGVAVVEVALGDNGLSWDSHTENFTTVKRLSERLDQSWSALLADLKDRGLLERTTFAWMGEFGRTPAINPQGGRDHFPNAWTCVLGGAGIQGGSIVGKTSDDGMEVTERPVAAPDLLATICRAVGVDPNIENVNEDRRPFKISEGIPISEILS
jgi:Protein of unknown function (DUF1501)